MPAKKRNSASPSRSVRVASKPAPVEKVGAKVEVSQDAHLANHELHEEITRRAAREDQLHSENQVLQKENLALKVENDKLAKRVADLEIALDDAED